MQNKLLLVIIGVVAILVLGVGGFYMLSRQPAESQNTQSTTQEVPATTGDDVDEMVVNEEGDDVMEEEEVMEEEVMMEVREVVVDGDEFSFSPSSLRVTEGEKIKLVFNNVGQFPHNFMVDELGVATETIQGGLSDTVEFAAGQSGTFNFFCSVGNHRARGMEGELVVN